MDEPGLAPALHHDALRGLSRVNAVSFTVSSVWRAVRQLLRETRQDTLKVLDLACGGGDLAVGLALRARRAGCPVAVDGCDISETALRFAEARAERRGVEVRFYRHDALANPLPDTYDVVVTSLFLHHLEWQDAVSLLNRCGAAVRRLLIVSDLDRSPNGLVLAWLGTHLLSRSPVVHIDAIRSVRAAFTRAEARQLAIQAGLVAPRFQTTLAGRWPCRWQLVAERLR